MSQESEVMNRGDDSPTQHDAEAPSAAGRRQFIRRNAQLAAAALFGTSSLDTLVERIANGLERRQLLSAAAQQAADRLVESGVFGSRAFAEEWECQQTPHECGVPYDCATGQANPHGCNVTVPYDDMPGCTDQSQPPYDCVQFNDHADCPAVPGHTCTDPLHIYSCTDGDADHGCLVGDPPAAPTPNLFTCQGSYFNCGDENTFVCGGAMIADFICYDPTPHIPTPYRCIGDFECHTWHLFSCGAMQADPRQVGGFTCENTETLGGFTCDAAGQCNIPGHGTYALDKPGDFACFGNIANPNPNNPNGPFDCAADDFACETQDSFSCVAGGSAGTPDRDAFLCTTVGEQVFECSDGKQGTAFRFICREAEHQFDCVPPEDFDCHDEHCQELFCTDPQQHN